MQRLRFAGLLTFTLSIAGTASAQLLSGTLQPVVGCTISLTKPAASPELDTALQTWARDGAPGRVRVIVSAQRALLDPADVDR